MKITKVNIFNYKCFVGKFTLEFKSGINIIVGNNETGKSTILEAIHLALSGIINGRYLKNELNQYLFNDAVVNNYLNSLNSDQKQESPKIAIEIFFSDDVDKKFQGSNNSEKTKALGVALKIEFDDDYKNDYEELIKIGEKIEALPIEYYKISWYSFSFDAMTTKTIPIKTVLIDSASSRSQNSSDMYISRTIQNNLDDKEKAQISQAYRKMKGSFGKDQSVIEINKKIQDGVKITQKSINISAELPTQTAWENALMTFVNDIPFHQIGKGEQCIIKTNLALSNNKTKEAAVILLEEPENHLTHSKMNELVSTIEKAYENKQIIITTHNSFIINKLSINNVILLNNHKTFRLNELENETYEYFKKLSGYPTLRLLLSKKAILVEGGSDELIFQKAYYVKNKKLPIQDGIDVLSVGLSFKRFLDISIPLEIETAVIIDNDGDYKSKVNAKFKDFVSFSFIKIFYDTNNDLNTLEPQFVNANKSNLKTLCEIIGINHEKDNTPESIINYMMNNKTDWALRVSESEKYVSFPEYIMRAVEWCNGK